MVSAFVMAGLVPAIHVFLSEWVKTWMSGIADKFTQSAKSRLLWPGMTNFIVAFSLPTTDEEITALTRYVTARRV
jgi:hypothetical protein